MRISPDSTQLRIRLAACRGASAAPSRSDNCRQSSPKVRRPAAFRSLRPPTDQRSEKRSATPDAKAASSTALPRTGPAVAEGPPGRLPDLGRIPAESNASQRRMSDELQIGPFLRFAPAELLEHHDLSIRGVERFAHRPLECGEVRQHRCITVRCIFAQELAESIAIPAKRTVAGLMSCRCSGARAAEIHSRP